MTDHSAVRLIQPLIAATDEGRVDWEPDPTGGFLTRIGENTVNVYQLGQRNGMSMTIRVLNRDGAVVDSETFGLGDERCGILSSLLSRIKAKAFNTDRVIDDILAQLAPH